MCRKIRFYMNLPSKTNNCSDFLDKINFLLWIKIFNYRHIFYNVKYHHEHSPSERKKSYTSSGEQKNSYLPPSRSQINISTVTAIVRKPSKKFTCNAFYSEIVHMRRCKKSTLCFSKSVKKSTLCMKKISQPK